MRVLLIQDAVQPVRRAAVTCVPGGDTRGELGVPQTPGERRGAGGPYSPSSSPVSLSSSRSVESRLAASTHCPSLLKHTLVMGPGGTRGVWGVPQSPPTFGSPPRAPPQAPLTADVVGAELPRAEVVAPHPPVHGAAGRGEV